MSHYCAVCKGQGVSGICQKCGRQICDSCGSVFFDTRAGADSVRCVNCGGFYSDSIDFEQP